MSKPFVDSIYKEDKIKMLSTYVKDIESELLTKALYTLVVEHRHGSPKRDFIFVDKAQGRFIPTDPKYFWALVWNLRTLLMRKMKPDTKLLVVSTGERSTALARALAESVNETTCFVQVTEDTLNEGVAFEFTKEVSRKVSGRIYGYVDERMFNYVLFVDDEVTTGKSMVNILNAFKSKYRNASYGIMSVCNFMKPTDKKTLGNDVDLFYLIGGTLINKRAKMNVDVDTNKVFELPEYSDLPWYEYNRSEALGASAPSFRDNRMFCTVPYTDSDKIASMYTRIISHDITDSSEDVLIIGTEEFMYIPILIARTLQSKYPNLQVRIQSTVRTCIDVIKDSTYGILTRHDLPSPYDKNRRTYLYNIEKYSKVYVCCNTFINDNFAQSMLHVLTSVGNKEEDIKFLII